ncbi:hypothetical protein LR48_Vigan06g091600 [Vigna angularis]|uniref:Uncharacterized protein n=1 Tax=Phaseolus angularis TaxID=3914 RepID=A0A0L9URV8_PHAAN|nr:hypothetical protein LR48_Vigan06g091600 [Vigna angularis]
MLDQALCTFLSQHLLNSKMLDTPPVLLLLPCASCGTSQTGHAGSSSSVQHTSKEASLFAGSYSCLKCGPLQLSIQERILFHVHPSAAVCTASSPTHSRASCCLQKKGRHAGSSNNLQHTSKEASLFARSYSCLKCGPLQLSIQERILFHVHPSAAVCTASSPTHSRASCCLQKKGNVLLLDFFHSRKHRVLFPKWQLEL